MPWPAEIEGGPQENAGIVTASSIGTNVFAPGTANTKTGAVWAQLIASTTRDTQWIEITVTNNSSARFLVDIGIGAAAAEVVLIPDLHAGNLNTSFGGVYAFPLHIPAGSRLSARCQSSVLSTTVRVSARLMAGPWLGFGATGDVVAYGPTLADSGLVAVTAGAINTEGAWAELSAATAYQMKWINVGVFHDATAVVTGSGMLLDLAIGALGAEVVIVPDIVLRASVDTDGAGPEVSPIPVDIPAGVRLAARLQASIAAGTSTVWDVGVWGVS